MSLIIGINSVEGVTFPDQENQLRLKVGPYTLRIDVKDNNWQYDCQMVYQNSPKGCEIALLSDSTAMIIAKGNLSDADCRGGFSGKVRLEPSGTVDLTVEHSKETISHSKIQKRDGKKSMLGASTGPSVVGLSSAAGGTRSTAAATSEPMAVSPLYSGYVAQGGASQAAINPGATVVIPVAGQQKKLESVMQSEGGVKTTKQDWRDINSVHITVFGMKNLSFGGDADQILRCQLGEFSRLSHVLCAPGANPKFDTDFHYPAATQSHTINFDLIDVAAKTVIASCTLDLRSLIMSNRVRTWNGFLPLDVIGGGGGGSLGPLISAAVTLSKKNLTRPMVASPQPAVQPTEAYLGAKGLKSKAGKFKLIIDKKSDSSGSVSHTTRKKAKCRSKYLERNRYQSVQVVLSSLDNIEDSHGGEPISGFEVACGKHRVTLPAQLAGRTVTANAKFVLPYTGNKYLRVTLKDSHGASIAVQKMNLEALLFKKDSGMCEKTLILKAIDQAHPIADAHAKATLSVVMGMAALREAEVEMCPMPCIMLTAPNGNANTIVEGMKGAVHKGQTDPSSMKMDVPAEVKESGFLGQASMMMSHFSAPRVIDDSDEELACNINGTFYNGVAEADGLGFLRGLNDLSHANGRLGATVDLLEEFNAAVQDEEAIYHDEKNAKLSSCSSEETSKRKKPHTPAGLAAGSMLFTAFDMDTFGAGDQKKTITGGTVAAMKLTVNGLEEVPEEEEEEEGLCTMEAQHGFHSFTMTAEALNDVNVKGVDQIWIETKYGGISCPSYHYPATNASAVVNHLFEFPIDSIGCKYAYVTLFGSDSKSKQAARRCMKLGQAVVDLEAFILGGSKNYEQETNLFCFPASGGNLDIRATMFNEPTKEMTPIGKMKFALDLRNDVILGPMAYPKAMAQPSAKVATTLADEEVTKIQQATFRPPPINAALLAGITGAKGKASAAPKKADAAHARAPAPHKAGGAGGAGAAGGLMGELLGKVNARKDAQKNEVVFNAQMTTTDVIKGGAGGLEVSKMELPNSVLLEVHSLKIINQSLKKAGGCHYLKISFPSISPYANVKAKTPTAPVTSDGNVKVSADGSRSVFPLPYDVEDNTIFFEMYDCPDLKSKGKLIAKADIQNLKDVWSLTLEKVVSRRRLQLRQGGNLVGEAVVSLSFQSDPAMEKKDFRKVSKSVAMTIDG